MASSPAKRSAPAATRECLTEDLRNSGLIHELSTEDFRRAFFRDVIHTEDCSDYFPVRRDELINFIAISKEQDAYKPVCDLLNEICDKYATLKKIDEHSALQFVDHSRHAPCQHPLSYTNKVAKQKPDIVVVKKVLALLFLADVVAWKRAEKKAKSSNGNKPAIAWPHIPSIVEGKGPDEPHAHFQAATYLGSVLQARPDMIGCFGLAVAPRYFRVLWSDASGVYYTQEIPWTAADAMEILVLYVHQIHTPLLDTSITLAPAVDTHDGLAFKDWPAKSYASPPVWLVKDDGEKVYVVDSIFSVGPAWSRKNWVGCATRAIAADGSEERLEPAVVVKDSFHRVERLKSSEGDILRHIQRDGPVPGVVKMRTGFVVRQGLVTTAQPLTNVPLPSDMNDSLRFPERVKYRLVVEGSMSGHMFTACSSVQDALMMIYDLLEMSILLHAQHKVIHRDLSIANVVRLPYSLLATVPDDAISGGSYRPVFIRQLLAYRDSQSALQNSPMCLLFDFDNAYQDGHPTGALRTANSTFVASAISDGETTCARSRVEPIHQLSGEALKSYLSIYGQETYDIRSKFHDNLSRLSDFDDIPLVHEPRHEAESCYWLTAWFALLALPAKTAIKDDTTAMSGYHTVLERHCIGASPDARRHLLDLSPNKWAAALHPGLRSLVPFLHRLSQAVAPEYGRIGTKLDPYHLQETMKRIVLDEIWRLKTEGTPIELDTTKQRKPMPPPKTDGLAASAPTVHAVRTAEASAASGHATQAKSVNAASGSTRTAASGKEMKRKAAKESSAPPRRSKRQCSKQAGP